MDTLSENTTPEFQPKKRRTGRNALISIAVILLVLVCSVAALGVYDIPLVSSVFGSNKPRNLGIKASPEALASLLQKMPVEIVKADGGKGMCLECKQTYEGQIAVDARRTSEEITSFLQLFPREKGDILKNTQVRFIDGGLEISTKLKKYVHAPVYVKTLVARTGPKSVSIEIVSGKIGRLNVPERYLLRAEEFFTDLVNDHLAEIEGFSMEFLEYHDGYSDFRGTYPAVVKPAPGTWTDHF